MNTSFALLAILLVLIGITIGAVLAYLANRSRHASRLTLELIQRNQQAKFDALQFLESTWPLLRQAGFTGLHWHADWYGGERWGGSGEESASKLERRLEATDIQVNVTLSLPMRSGEDRYFLQALAETFFLLLQCDLWVKTGAVAAATAQLSRFSLFLRHDMKNFAQYVELLDDQVHACPPAQAGALLERLQRTTPLLRERSSLLLRSLQNNGQPDHQSKAGQAIDLAGMLRQSTALHGLAVEISGSAQINFPGSALDTAIDNIFKNYADIARRPGGAIPTLRITIAAETSEQVLITIEDPTGKPVAHLERLFEPFWSDQPTGLGIGLYQAKQALALHNASLTARKGDGGPCFVLRLPANSGKYRN